MIADLQSFLAFIVGVITAMSAMIGGNQLLVMLCSLWLFALVMKILKAIKNPDDER